MITLTEGGLAKLHQCGDHAEREREGKKWQALLKAVWETIREQITEGIQEIGTYIGQDVRSKLNDTCEMFREDVGSQLENFRERQQALEQRIRNVASAVADRSLGYNSSHSYRNDEILLEP